MPRTTVAKLEAQVIALSNKLDLANKQLAEQQLAIEVLQRVNACITTDMDVLARAIAEREITTTNEPSNESANALSYKDANARAKLLAQRGERVRVVRIENTDTFQIVAS